jgi:superfamily II DNA or RNA helicase
VLSSTIQRLERDLPIGVSVFDRHHFTIVSTDFIKSDRRAADFELKCPEFVIVDEAHGCTLAGGVGRSRQQRFDLIRKIASNPKRHVVLVTATPHSGNEQAFRSLLGLLDEEFFDLPSDIAKEERDTVRRKLARHLVQRRRADIRHYLETDTTFPTRLDKEETYSFSPQYRALFDDILAFVREFVEEGSDDKRRRRVRYWSALALLRCVSSSPTAAAATLRSRATVDSAETEEIDEVGRQSVLDEDEGDAVSVLDLSPGAESESDSEGTRRKLLAFAKRADSLQGASDLKLQGLIKELKSLLKDGFKPIVFCRFIDTAEYVCKQLREALSDRVRVEAVTGLLPSAEREGRIEALAKDGGEYVLVCTDCLSEGVNLQHAFDAVIHYDLCWNPTRHEQREGRVDRFGQKSPQVRVMTYYGRDNPIDGVILDVLIRKHKSIKSDLGVTVAVPSSSEQIAQTLFQGALFRERASGNDQPLLFEMGSNEKTLIKEFHAAWENVREKERASRSRFAIAIWGVEERSRRTKNSHRKHRRFIVGGDQHANVIHAFRRDHPVGLQRELDVDLMACDHGVNALRTLYQTQLVKHFVLDAIAEVQLLALLNLLETKSLRPCSIDDPVDCSPNAAANGFNSVVRSDPLRYRGNARV